MLAASPRGLRSPDRWPPDPAARLRSPRAPSASAPPFSMGPREHGTPPAA